MKKYILNIYIVLSVIFSGLFGYYFIANGAGNTFETRLSVVEDDYTAPTIPTGLVASALSATQVNLVWNASTDDVAVTGYRIFRDGIVIASTTSLFYQDSGLTASTTYSYTVEAFDSVPRYSGESTPSEVTTDEAPVASPSPTPSNDQTTGVSSGSREINIYGLFVTPFDTFGVIEFKTTQPSLIKVFWGKSNDYEMGSMSGFFYEINHLVNIKELEQDTKYFYRIEATSSNGKISAYQSSFKTVKSIEESILTNVQNFRAIPLENSIALDWNNPSSDIFDSVRIVRSDKFFPRDVFDGEAIYEGKKESYEDKEVIAGKTYYYAIFAKDENGNYSSGALAQARIKLDGEVDAGLPKDPFDGINIIKNVDPSISSLKLNDFDFIQKGKKLFDIDNTVTIDGSENLTISLDYNKVAEILKTIAITLVDPSDSEKVFPFLLRVNKDKTAYEATIAPLGKSGKYEMKIVVLDYKNQGLKRIEGSLQAYVLEGVSKFLRDSSDFKSVYKFIGIVFLILTPFYIIRIHLNVKK